MSNDEKRYTFADNGITFVKTPSDIDPFDKEPHILRAKLSCGHVVGPQTLTDYCRFELDSGRTELRCPECKKEWPYEEVRKLAKLTREEQQYFETKLGTNASKRRLNFKSCPGCRSFIIRSSPSNLCVTCSVCSERTGKTYEFCWQCLKVWKGPGPRSDRCDNVGCSNRALDLLMNCNITTLPKVQNVECPSVRACPTCGVLLEHSREYCKDITCCRCKTKFCFVCLKLTPECKRTSGPYIRCKDGVATRQTSIPFWNN